MKESKKNKIVVTAPLGVGGVTTMMINIQNNMDRDKLNFDYLVYHDRKEPCEEQVIELGSKKLVASADDISFLPLRRIVRMIRLTKLCKKEGIDIIHFNAGGASELTNIIAAKLGGVKHVTIHSHNAGYGQTRRINKIVSELSKPLLPLFCDDFWGCSDLAARFMFPRRIINSGKYRVLPNGIDLKKYDFAPAIREKVRNELNIGSQLVVGHAGRFIAQKNHTFLIDIFKAIHERKPDSVLLLFGVGELQDQMIDKARTLGLSDCIRFMGASDRMAEMWQAMDVLIMPSLHEGLPVTGIEAQASGLPCLFSDDITNEVDVTGTSAFLSRSVPTDVWADTAIKISEKQRKSLLYKLEEAQYDIKQTALTMQEYYMRLIRTMRGDGK